MSFVAKNLRVLCSRLNNFHHNLSFARAVEFAQINSLPSSQKQFAFFKRNGDAHADQRRFDMRVGIMFKMFEICVILRNKFSQKSEHVAFHVRVCVFVYSQASRRVLDKQNAHAVATIRQKFFDFARDFNHFLTLV